jgi:hypothetical protein
MLRICTELGSFPRDRRAFPGTGNGLPNKVLSDRAKVETNEASG